jgi:endonuclease III
LPDPTFFRRGLNPEAIAFHPNHWTMNPRSPKFRNGMHGNGRSFKKLAWNKPSFTVAYGNREIHIHPRGRRRLSVFEAMLLQGFPRTYELRGTLSNQVTQISDAVPPALAAAVAGAVEQSVYVPIKELQNSLLRWFESNERSFPWRRTRNAYRVLVAEKLLQQTAATGAVVKAFREIVRRYPSWVALAAARQSDLNNIVAPLGFAYRASELVRLARAIVRCHAGQVPRDLKSLLALPGVGDYCARAVMSFSFGQSLAVIDTNVARFLVRYFGLNFRLSKNPARDRRLQHIANALVPVNRSRDFNLAVLDLCAAHCKARQPECQGCPVRKNCAHGNATLKSASATRIPERTRD